MIEGKRIVVTGLTGQIGGAVAKALVPGNTVYGLARFTAAGSRAVWQAAGVETVACDLSAGDYHGAPEDIDYVLHFAAWTGVEIAPGGADAAFRHNAEATGLLMARYRHARAFLYASTMGVYRPEPPTGGYCETDPLGPGPAAIDYTASKLAAEGVARAVCRIHGLPTVIARVTCPYGDHGHGGLPKALILARLISGEPIAVAPDGEKLRSPLHLEDFFAFLEPLLATASVPATIVNCGGDAAVSIEGMARFMAPLLGVEPRFAIRDPYPWPYGHLNPSKRIAITGPARIHWTAGLREIVERHRDHADCGDRGSEYPVRG